MNGDERAREGFGGWEEYEDEARRLYEEGRFREALDLLRAGLAQHPGSVELQVSVGYTHLALESYAWARRAFQRALALEAEHEEALVGLGDTLLKLGERPGAFLCFERILELGHGGDPDLMLAVARALYREELFERALRFYRMAETSADAEAELGYTLHQMGRAEDAARHVAAALELDPQHHEARVFYANLLYDRGDGEEALSHYERVPPGRMWDPLAVWRTVELLRSYRGLGTGEEALDPTSSSSTASGASRARRSGCWPRWRPRRRGRPIRRGAPGSSTSSRWGRRPRRAGSRRSTPYGAATAGSTRGTGWPSWRPCGTSPAIPTRRWRSSCGGRRAASGA